MAYDALAQDEPDAHSESNASDILNAVLEYHALADRVPLSNDDEHATNNMDSPRITRSREGSIPLRHPTPDLQSLQGGYAGNVERLEQSAERLSLSSDIGEEIRRMRLEQQRSESRRSSIQNSQLEHRSSASSLHRQLSYGHGSHAANSIVGTNSIARSGGFSPAAYVASPRESMHSGSWSHQNSVKGRSASQGLRLAQLAEPEHEANHLDSTEETQLASHPPLPEPEHRPLKITNEFIPQLEDVEIPHSHTLVTEEGEEGLDQNRTSVDTYRQRDTLFSDFDGTHTQENPRESPPPHDASSNQRPPSQMLQAEETSGPSMVYYPAPVPMMLNLPKRLSKMPATPMLDKRRTRLMNSLPADARKSAVWLPESLGLAGDESTGIQEHGSDENLAQKHRSMANLPPQLRASMFFDYPAARQDIQIKGESAVATLDSILDASAYAPVSAFTDHPIAGRIGADIYDAERPKPKLNGAAPEDLEKRKRRSSVNKLVKRSSSTDLLEGSKRRNSSLLSLGNFGRRKSSGPNFEDAQEYQDEERADEQAPLQHHDAEPGDENDTHHDTNEDVKEGDEEDFPIETDYGGQPTTLLAELQIRKQQQKLRTRTAATAFPDGMHSTLLQLDAVAQVEKQARKQKQTTLAWEDPHAAQNGAEEEDDDDVPLGMLHAGRNLSTMEKARRYDEDRPLGLIAKREMEDNEPLSSRRARLRGHDAYPPNRSLVQSNTMQSLEFPNTMPHDASGHEEDGDEDHPHETLGDRMRRLRATQINTELNQNGDDFASDMLSHFASPEPAEHEQQAQVAKGRKHGPAPAKTPEDTGGEEETLAQRRQRLQASSAATKALTNGQQVAAQEEVQQTDLSRPQMPQRRSMADVLQAHPAAGAGVRKVSSEVQYAPATQARNTAWAREVNRQVGLGAGGRMASYSDGRFAIGSGQIPGAGGGVDARQMDMVDRWRQSVV